ncbi:DUF2628 domain-containing protein [Jiella marina]|uniref:DUF2628 domain-containing protein n=1 Tax=Jiella sp. LLJ827 TaxID=2917712 RepID=UPI002100B93D|nr:DUF2628 domain-containing protein [Jiella sp. LLJ827]MCQ0990477.1 DUF2628 domain-containing protein [Jiella sp. LLJ827]
MTRYMVFEPPAEEESGPSEAAIFVKDRFSFFAFLFTFLWLFRYGLWFSGIIVLVLIVGINFLGEVQGYELSAAILSFLIGLIIGLEGPSLRAAKLRRKGWQDAAAFEADDREEAEIIYYHRHTADLEEDDREDETQPDLRAEPWRGPGNSFASFSGGRQFQARIY